MQDILLKHNEDKYVRQRRKIRALLEVLDEKAETFFKADDREKLLKC